MSIYIFLLFIVLCLTFCVTLHINTYLISIILNILLTIKHKDKEMKYKLLVLDLDGTLTNDEKIITPKTYDALMKAQEEGVKIVLASGRPTFGIAPLAEKLKLKDYGGYILAFNGCRIINWQSREIISDSVLDPEVMPYLYECSKKSGFPILTYQGEDIVTEYPEDQYVIEEARINKMPVRKMNDFMTEVKYPINKCLIVGEPERLHVLEIEMAEKLQGRMGIFRSAPFFLELVPLNVDKAKTLNILIKKIGITREEVVACGDGYNDLSMIEFAGMGVAMKNAVDEVKAKANYITIHDNNHDGIAEVIEKFF